MLPWMFALACLVAPPAQPVAENPACPGCGSAVSEKSPTVVVKGKAYRACCKHCAAMIAKDPDKYFEKDGTPKNAKGGKQPAKP